MEKEAIRLEREHVHNVYEKIAPYFNDKRYKAWPKVEEFLLAQEPGSLIADIGCGNGKYLHINSPAFKVGCDCCFPLAEAARNLGHEVMVCDGLNLPYRTNCFDAVLSIAVIHHFSTKDRRIRAIQEMTRILKVGGRIMIYVWAMEQKRRKFEKQDILVPWHLKSMSPTDSPLKLTENVKPNYRNGTLNKHLDRINGTLEIHQWTKSSSIDEKDKSNKSFEKSLHSKFLSRSLDSGLDVKSKCPSTDETHEGILKRCYDYCIQIGKSSGENLIEQTQTTSFLRRIGGFFPKYIRNIESNGINGVEAKPLPQHELSRMSLSKTNTNCTDVFEDYNNVALPDLLSGRNSKTSERSLKHKHSCKAGDKINKEKCENINSSEMSTEHQFGSQRASGECLRYYHTFKKGELTDLIQQYIPDLHVVQTYFDHSNWCVIAEKIQYWKI
ncbi:putative tRNA methyltransferase 9B [Discoglossus pictus]